MFTRRMLWAESAVSDESEREEYDNLEGDIGVADGDNVL